MARNACQLLLCKKRFQFVVKALSICEQTDKSCMSKITKSVTAARGMFVTDIGNAFQFHLAVTDI